MASTRGFAKDDALSLLHGAFPSSHSPADRQCDEVQNRLQPDKTNCSQTRDRFCHGEHPSIRLASLPLLVAYSVAGARLPVLVLARGEVAMTANATLVAQYIPQTHLRYDVW